MSFQTVTSLYGHFGPNAVVLCHSGHGRDWVWQFQGMLRPGLGGAETVHCGLWQFITSC